MDIKEIKDKYYDEAVLNFEENHPLTYISAINMYVAISIMLESQTEKDLKGHTHKYERLRNDAWKLLRQSIGQR